MGEDTLRCMSQVISTSASLCFRFLSRPCDRVIPFCSPTFSVPSCGKQKQMLQQPQVLLPDDMTTTTSCCALCSCFCEYITVQMAAIDLLSRIVCCFVSGPCDCLLG